MFHWHRSLQHSFFQFRTAFSCLRVHFAMLLLPFLVKYAKPAAISAQRRLNFQEKSICPRNCLTFFYIFGAVTYCIFSRIGLCVWICAMPQISTTNVLISKINSLVIGFTVIFSRNSVSTKTLSAMLYIPLNCWLPSWMYFSILDAPSQARCIHSVMCCQPRLIE